MPNGKRGDNPLTDLTIHGEHPFPPDIEETLLRIDELGRRAGRWPLGANWPFSPRELRWEKGKDLDGARRALAHLLSMLEAGRGDEVLLDPRTRRPLSEGERPQPLSGRWSVLFAAFAALLVPVFLIGWQWSAARFPALDFVVLLLVLPIVYWVLYFTKRQRLWARRVLLVIALAAIAVSGMLLIGILIVATMMSA